MGVASYEDRRRVFVPHALGADEFLRVTWHEQRRVVVVSHWHGDHCVAATPVRVADLAELAELTVAALASAMPPPPMDRHAEAWPGPDPATLVTTDVRGAMSA